MAEELLAEFDKCPVCGSPNRLMESLLGENEGGATPCLLLMSSVAANPRVPVLIGSVVPVGIAIVDACLDCGVIYAPKLIKGEAKAGMGPPQQTPPDIPAVRGN